MRCHDSVHGQSIHTGNGFYKKHACNVDIIITSPVVRWHGHGMKCQIKTLATAQTIFKTALAVEREREGEREREREREREV